jgi:hypothetical protein
MMAIDNPILSLKNLTDLENKISENKATADDYEEIDFFISSIGGDKNYLKNVILQNGFRDFYQYVSEKSENKEGRLVQLGKIHGTVLGAISFLKTYAKDKGFYL